MLKGIKKGKVDDQVQNKTQTKSQKNQQDIQSHILRQKNMKNLKNQYILQDQIEEEDQRGKNEQQHQTFTLITQSSNSKSYVQLKECAHQILQNFFMGKDQNILQKLKQFQILQQKINSISLRQLKSAFLTNQSGSQVLNNGKDSINSQSKNIPKKQNISKFAYQFNYESDQEKEEKTKKKKKNNRPLIRSQKIQQYCLYCPQNQQLKLISASNYAFLAFPKRKTFRKYWHFILAPVEHQQSSIGLNQDVITQIMNYKKCLLQMFDAKKMHVVFLEQFSSQNSHIYIQCLAMPLIKGQDMPFFFKQSLQSIEGNWTTHKNIIKIQKEKGGLSKQIPKKMKYFYIDFSLGYGYAHVIQNQKFWNRQFCYQILATALGLQKYEVKTTQEFTEQQNTLRLKQFQIMWQKYDWTKLI